MSWLQPKLNLRVAQKQILTPGLVQMVSVLALNRLELREMINQEMVANPMLEELSDDGQTAENYSDEAFLKAETEKIPETIPSTSLTSLRSSTSTWTAEPPAIIASARSSSDLPSTNSFPRRRDSPNI